MPAATLSTAGALSAEFTVTAGALYAIGASGDFKGGIVKVEDSLPTTPAEFTYLDEFNQGFRRQYRATGTKLKMTLYNQDRAGVSLVHAEVTAAV